MTIPSLRPLPNVQTPNESVRSTLRSLLFTSGISGGPNREYAVRGIRALLLFPSIDSQVQTPNTLHENYGDDAFTMVVSSHPLLH